MTGYGINDRDLVVEDNTIYEIDSSCYIDISKEIISNKSIESNATCKRSRRRTGNGGTLLLMLLLISTIK